MMFPALQVLFVATFCSFAAAGAAEAPAGNPPLYEQRRGPNMDGIGKFYLDREIAHVMGHQGADWLERPERVDEERTDLLVPALKLEPGMAVADIGAGTGYFSWRLAEAVGVKGTVYAVDIQPEMLDLLQSNMKKRGVASVKSVLGTVKSPMLPDAALDLVLMVDVYHEFDHPHEMLAAITRSLKPGGRVVFVEYRAEDPKVPIKRLHKMTEAQVKKEAAMHALDWVETLDILPRQHIVIFKRRD